MVVTRRVSRAERCGKCPTVQGQTHKGDQANQNVSEGWTGKSTPSETFFYSRQAICKAKDDHSLQGCPLTWKYIGAMSVSWYFLLRLAERANILSVVCSKHLYS